MGLHELEVRNFRLFDHLIVEPDPEAVTVFVSPNGTGKTSVLEAVYALATASSFRTTSASDMIKNGQDLAEVHGVLFHRERRVGVDLTLSRGVRTTKRMLVNGQKPRSRADLSDALPVTIFTPEGVDVIRQGPEHRRTFLTTLLTDVDLTTGEVIERFARVLSQRNAALRALRGERPTPDQRVELDVWSGDLARHGEELVVVRRKVLAALAPLVEEYYQRLSESDQRVEIDYRPSWTGSLAAALAAHEDDDRLRGHTSVGPHRDDVAIALQGRDTRHQASQGEQRSLALALRLAGDQLVRQRRGVDPLLLLDDVFSELDPRRSDRLLELLPTGQTLVTTASPLPSRLTPAAVIDLTRSSR